MDSNKPLRTPPLWQQAWHLLGQATEAGNGGFTTAVVATVDPDNHQPRSRTVVLRDVAEEPSELTFYSDLRATKVAHLLRGSEVSFTFWDGDRSLQFCGGGPARLAASAVHDRIFVNLPKHGRRAYATRSAPGATIEAAGTDLPSDWESRALPATDYARANFAVVIVKLRWAEVLHLDREGNTRLAAERPGGRNEWSFRYVAP